MKRQLILAGAIAVGAVTACTPPPASVAPGIPALPPCGVYATRIFETNKIPCIPVAPQRLDVVLAISNQFNADESYAGGVRCGRWGGAVYWQDVNGVRVQVCQSVVPAYYGVW